MNNIAIQNRTDYAYGEAPGLTLLRQILNVGTPALLWISFSPFAATSESLGDSSLINQIGYTSICTLSLFLLLSTAPRAHVSAAVSIFWLTLFTMLFWSAIIAPESSEAIRAVAFSIIVVVLAASWIVQIRSASELARTLRFVSMLVLILSYVGLVLMPDAAIHQAGEVEAEHAGLWRGIFTHKNIAGPVMSMIVFAGIFVARCGMRFSGIVIAIAALFFVLNTGSKTSLAIVPAVTLTILLPSWLGMRGLGALAILFAVIGAHALTIGTVYSSALDSILRFIDDTTTFTGRIQIWEFAQPYVSNAVWTGYGYDGFWEAEITRNAEQPFDREWDPRGIVHGHNGFLDIALMMGVPAMVGFIWLVLIIPVVQYVRTLWTRSNILMADLFFMMIAFALLNSALESFFFRRSDPVWLSMVIGLFGMRLVSRVPMRG